MERKVILETLRRHESELRAAGVLHLRLFGSVARDEATSVSDIDLMAEFDGGIRLTLVKLGSLQSRLSDMLGSRVDLSSSALVADKVQKNAEREGSFAF